MDSDDCYDSGADCSDCDSFTYSDDDGLKEDDDGKTTNAAAVFSTLRKDDIERSQEDLIAEISSVLSVPRAAAIALLVSTKWNSERVQDEWFSDEEKMRRFLGLSTVAPAAKRVEEIECNICFDCFSIPDFTSLNCGHNFCNACWTQYVKVSIDDGIGCLSLRCPEPKCPVLVDQSTIETLIEADYMEKYSRILRRSYIEEKSDHKWCPAPDCETAVRFEDGEREGANYDVVCDCSHEFCFNCSEEAHRPVDCGTVEKWMRKNQSESDNVTWILANTKQCPKCHKPIEKNQGCMHMTCKSPCGHQFCWLCLGDWTSHGGNFYHCNTYEKRKEAGELNEEETKRENAKRMADRYAHYFERWATNRSAMKRSAEDLRKLQSAHFASLTAAYSLTDAELESVSKAWMQIKECRRVLEWTYAYGFYLEEDKRKKDLFEFLQGEAESSLEKLHSCAEEEIRKFSVFGGDGSRAAEEDLNKFHEYKVKLERLTNATENYFQELVKLLENGLVDLSY